HTRFSRDWSSDVCSSDLCCHSKILPESGARILTLVTVRLGHHTERQRRISTLPGVFVGERLSCVYILRPLRNSHTLATGVLTQRDRKSVVEGMSVDIGGL